MTEKEIKIARNCMETYLNFASQTALSDKQREFYSGSAAAINDFLCQIGYGDTVKDLSLRLQIGDNRIEELCESWENVTNDPESQEWRENLTEEETALVEQWDSKAESQICKMCTDILEIERNRKSGID